VISFAERRKTDAAWLCRCDCGAEKIVLGRSLREGNTKSCAGPAHYAAGGLSGTKEYAATAQNKRRARKQKAGGSHTHAEVVSLHELQRGKCARCKKRVPLSKVHRDHRMPLALGGDDSIYNIQLLCKACNLSKSARHPIDDAQRRGLLL
jgi:5-methylcytosine-specific restriction endonuclease McrA